jgi:hypothetical protein
MRKLVRKKLYLIKWSDTFSFDGGGWVTTDEIAASAERHKTFIHTVGFYVGRFGAFEVFSSGLNLTKGMVPWTSPTFIPHGCIESITKLK